MAYYIYLYTCSYGYMNGLISYLPESEVAVARLNLYSLRQLGARPQPRGSYAYGYATRLHLVAYFLLFTRYDVICAFCYSTDARENAIYLQKSFPIVFLLILVERMTRARTVYLE